MNEFESESRVRFPRRERTGVFAGRTLPQFVIIVAAFMLALASIAIPGLVGLLPICLLAIAVGAWQHRREPLINLIAVSGLHLFASVTHQNRFERDVWARPEVIDLPSGTRPDGAPAPTVRDTLTLPGGLATIRLVDDPMSGSFLIDAKRGVVSIVVAVQSEAWELRDTAGQVSAYDGFVEWFSSLENLRGLREVVARVRIDRAPATAAGDYADRVDADFPADHVIPDCLRQEYDVVLQSARSRSMAFHNHITFTFSLSKLRSEVRHRGGGLSGVADFLQSVAELMEGAAESARLRWAGRLSCDEMDELLATSWDPVSTISRRERAAARTDPVHEAPPPVMAMRRAWDHIQVDGSLHAVYWIAEWPRTDVSPGFLVPILYAGSGTRVLTLQFRPEPVHISVRRLTRARAGIDFAVSLRDRFGVPATAEQDKEQEEVRERDGQLADGFVDVGFRGFVTVSADSIEALARARGELEMSAPSARLNLALLWGRQGQAFFTAVLPLGVGASR